jgi:hypothetical protein
MYIIRNNKTKEYIAGWSAKIVFYTPYRDSAYTFKSMELAWEYIVSDKTLIISDVDIVKFTIHND